MVTRSVIAQPISELHLNNFCSFIGYYKLIFQLEAEDYWKGDFNQKCSNILQNVEFFIVYLYRHCFVRSFFIYVPIFHPFKHPLYCLIIKILHFLEITDSAKKFQFLYTVFYCICQHNPLAASNKMWHPFPLSQISSNLFTKPLT